MQATATQAGIGRVIGAAGQSRADVVKAAVLAAMLGAFVVWGIGFSPIEVLHNAAHDARHSNIFPCH